MMNTFEAIVLGVGGVGSAALYHLARRGARALGIDRFEPGHDRGSSHGQTRLIRRAYFEHPDYVPLVEQAFAGWHALETQAGQKLFHKTGLLQVGPAGGAVLAGVRASARRHALEVENLSPRDAAARFGGFAVPADCEAVYEAGAGYLLVETCVRAFAQQAVSHGASLHIGETIHRWRPSGDGFVVETDRDRYEAKRLVVAAGAWAAQLLADLRVPFEVRRKPLYWFDTRCDVYRAKQGCPAFLYDLPTGCFYGVPQIDATGIKVARHSGGAVVADPLLVDRQIDRDDFEQVAGFVETYLPEAAPVCTEHTVCLYTMTPDEHFVVDRHPGHARGVFAAGLSGHGFKFTPVLGQALAEMALDGTTQLPVGFLTLHRPALRAGA